VRLAEFAKLEEGDLVRFLRGHSENDGHRTRVYAEIGDIGRVRRIARGKGYDGGPQALVSANCLDDVWCEPPEIEKLGILERIAWEVHLAEEDDRRKARWKQPL